jgi:DNA recombination protein RmuC
MEIVLLIVVVVIAVATLVGVRTMLQSQEGNSAVAQQQANEELIARITSESAAREKDLEVRLHELQSEIAKKQTDTFLNLAEDRLKQQAAQGDQQLKTRQEAIDKQLEGIGKELKSVQEYVAKKDKEQSTSLAQISQVIRGSKEATEQLRHDTQRLSEAMAGGQSRGRWGEQVAEDVLRVAGFVEGISYRKQQTTEAGSRPDFTFLLPDQRVLNMDVKMPMAAFNRYFDADSDAERDAAARQFVSDARSRIKEVTGRGYIDPDQGTLDYTLVFIPNEQVYGFIHEHDESIVEYALTNRVVICSPLTLFAVLAVIRQSTDNFRLEARTREIQKSIEAFRRQWDSYRAQTEKVARSFRTASGQWDELVGVRERQLDKAIEKVDSLRAGTDDLGGGEASAGALGPGDADESGPAAGGPDQLGLSEEQ